jgi:hypothetical protein
MSDQGRQSARIKAEEYYSRFEQEAETLLYYLRANGDFVAAPTRPGGRQRRLGPL